MALCFTFVIFVLHFFLEWNLKTRLIEQDDFLYGKLWLSVLNISIVWVYPSFEGKSHCFFNKKFYISTKVCVSNRSRFFCLHLRRGQVLKNKLKFYLFKIWVSWMLTRPIFINFKESSFHCWWLKGVQITVIGINLNKVAKLHIYSSAETQNLANKRK